MFTHLGSHSGLMVSVLIFRSSGRGSSPGWGHCVVFLGKTLNSDSASLHPGVSMVSGHEFNAGSNPAMDQHPIQGGIEILLSRRFMLQRQEIRAGPMGHLVQIQALPTCTFMYLTQSVTQYLKSVQCWLQLLK